MWTVTESRLFFFLNLLFCFSFSTKKRHIYIYIFFIFLMFFLRAETFLFLIICWLFFFFSSMIRLSQTHNGGDVTADVSGAQLRRLMPSRSSPTRLHLNHPFSLYFLSLKLAHSLFLSLKFHDLIFHDSEKWNFVGSSGRVAYWIEVLSATLSL